MIICFQFAYPSTNQLAYPTHRTRGPRWQRQVRKAGRQTKGVRLMNLGEGDTLIAVARNADEDAADDDDSETSPETSAT